MNPTKKFWNLNMVSNYNNRAVMNFFEISESMKNRLIMADEVVKSILPKSQ